MGLDEVLSFVSFPGVLRAAEIFVTTCKWDGMSKNKFLLFLANCEVCVHTGLMRFKSYESYLTVHNLDAPNPSQP